MSQYARIYVSTLLEIASKLESDGQHNRASIMRDIRRELIDLMAENVALKSKPLSCPVCDTPLGMTDGALYCPNFGCEFGDDDFHAYQQDQDERDFRADPSKSAQETA